MSETTLLLLAIAVASVVVALVVVLSLVRLAPPVPGRLDIAGVPARLECPVTGDLALVEIGFDPVGGRLAVVGCERFPDGVFQCGRECFPAYDQSPSMSPA